MAATEAQTPDLGKLRFLLVDDEEFMLNMLARILKGMGVENPLRATSAAEALKALDEKDLFGKIDIVLCDLNMPGMDGVEFLRHIADRGHSPGIVVVSGEDKRVLETVESLAKAHHLNILGSLSKPIKPDALAALLGKFRAGEKRPERGPAERIAPDELREGIRGDELEVFFQPKVAIPDKKLIGVESLVRWRHPENGLMGPASFIPVAEESGLIDDLTNAVFSKAMRHGGELRADGLDLKIGVNFSIDNLNRLDLPEWIVATASAEGMDPSRVILEVTESRLMEDATKPLEILTRLRLKRIAISIDDFGTGYSSMEQLKRIPFEELKIDRAFVFGAARDTSARAILESSVDLGKRLGMSLVAEGVETQEDWDLVAGLGCDLVQGYFVAKPMPAAQLPEWAADWERSA